MKHKTILIAVAIIALFVLLGQLPVKEYMNSLIAFFKGLGLWAPVLYLVFFTSTAGLFFPVGLLSMAGGIMFGWTMGLIIASVGTLASATIMFIIGRTFGKDWYEKKIKNSEKAQQLSSAVEQEGWRMMFMLRFVPIVHYIFLNVTCGLSRMKAKDYIFGTWLGYLPLLAFYVYTGTLTDSVFASPEDMGMGPVFRFSVLAAAIVMVGVFSVYIKKVLSKYVTIPAAA